MKVFPLIICFLLLQGLSTHAASYTMPIGVPDPGFGISVETPEIPLDWEDQLPGYYFVDYAGGSDSANLFGTPLSPRRTVPSPIPAGSLVVIQNDYFYTTGGVIKLVPDGDSGDWVAGESGPVFVVSNSSYNGAFTRSKVVITGSHLYLDGLAAKEGSLVQVGSPTEGYPADHITVRNCDIAGRITDGNGSRLTAGGAPNSPVKNVVFYNNTIHDSGDINSTSDVDAHLVTVGGYTSHVWLLDNTMYNASGSGFQVNGSPPREYTHNIYAGRNEIYDVRQSGLWVKYAKDVVFSQNHVHDIIHTSWSPAKGMGAQYEPEGLWMLYNKIHGVTYGIRLASTTGSLGIEWPIYVVGNAIYDVASVDTLTGGTSWESAAIHMQGGFHRYIYNNVINNVPNGINGSGTAGVYNLYNNIITNIDGDSGYHVWMEGSPSNTAIDNNILGQDSGDVKIRWGSSKAYNLDTLMANESVCENCMEGEPNFSNHSDGNFEVMNSALSQDKGAPLNVLYSHFENAFGQNLLGDTLSDGNSLEETSPRVLGGAVDIGIFEAEGAVSSKPLPPSILSVGD